MYDFIDVNEHTSTTPLPTEAVSIDGRYIENIVEGYRTLYVSGRESLGVELNTFSVGVADGETFKNRRYPARTLTVGFQLLCNDEAEFRERFNHLNNILASETSDFVFHDEEDKFFTGHPIMDAEIEHGRNCVTGEWHIYCAYPFKRSVDVVTLSSDDEEGVVVDGNTATFTFEYDGGYPAKPVLRAEFAGALEDGNYNEDGDCGFVAFVTDEEDIIQLGNPEAVDIDPLDKNDTLINYNFNALSGWTASGMTIASIKDAHWQKDKGQTLNFAKGIGSLKKTTVGGVNCTLKVVHRLCASTPSQTGTFRCHLRSGSNTVVGFTIYKGGNGTNGTVSYIIDGRVVGTDKIDLSYYNTNFGYCNKTPVYVTQTYTQRIKRAKVTKGKAFSGLSNVSVIKKTRTVLKGYNYTQSNLNSSITRNDNVVTFQVGNLPKRTYKSNDIAGVPFYDMVFETAGNLNTNAIRSCSLIKRAGVAFADIPNVFTAGDVVEADCNDANVYLYRDGGADGQLAPQYGALGNDWEDFDIKVGTNVIKVGWSDWVNEDYKPRVQIMFNKVYI